jgi:hypothetical protein
MIDDISEHIGKTGSSGKARKPKSHCIINLKGAKSSWWCCRPRVLFYSKLTPSVSKRDSDDTMIIFRINRICVV